MKADSKLNVGLNYHGNGNFSLSGRADFSNVGRLLVNGQQQFIDHKVLAVDVAEADCANTAGLALLIEWSTWCQSNRIKLLYKKPQDKLLEIVKINDVEQMLSFSH